MVVFVAGCWAGVAAAGALFTHIFMPEEKMNTIWKIYLSSLHQTGKLMLLLVVLLAMSMPGQSRAAVTRTVCATGCDFTSIQAAIRAADDGDTISVRDALLKESGIVVDKSVTIEGLGAMLTYVDATNAGRVFKIVTGTSVVIKKIGLINGKTAQDGGGILIAGGSLVLENAHVAYNKAGNGGGIAVDKGVLIARNLDLQGNNASAAGGCLYVSNGGAALVIDSDLNGNGDADHGAGIALEDPGSTLAVYRSSINVSQLSFGSSGHGAGVYTGKGTFAALVNSTIVGNVSHNNETEIYNQGSMQIRSCTIWSKTSSSLTGTVALENSADGSVNITESIITNSMAGSACLNHGAWTVNSPYSGTTANLSDDATCPGFTLSGKDPQLRDPAYYGGTNFIAALDWGSPAIDASTESNPPLEVHDQRGLWRLRELNTHDLGAYEINRTGKGRFPNSTIPDGNSNGITDTITPLNPTTGTILNTMVTLEAKHTYAGDLTFTLAHGTNQVALITKKCDTGDNINVSLYDNAPSSLTCGTGDPVLDGDFQPEGNLAVFDNTSMALDWQLKVVDDTASDTGTLDYWAVQVDYYAPHQPRHPYEDVKILVSQAAIGPGDTFYYRIELTAGTGITPADSINFVMKSPTGVTYGTPIVPEWTGMRCTASGRSMDCTGATVAAGVTFSIYLPLTNDTSIFSCTSGALMLNVNAESALHAYPQGRIYYDRRSAPLCKATSQGSTKPIGVKTKTPWAIYLPAILQGKNR